MCLREAIEGKGYGSGLFIEFKKLSILWISLFLQKKNVNTWD